MVYRILFVLLFLTFQIQLFAGSGVPLPGGNTSSKAKPKFSGSSTLLIVMDANGALKVDY